MVRSNCSRSLHIFFACYSGYATFVQKLLERGASLRKHNWAGMSAAVAGSCFARALIHYRALSLAGDTAFQCACKGLDAAKQACTRGVCRVPKLHPFLALRLACKACVYRLLEGAPGLLAAASSSGL